MASGSIRVHVRLEWVEDEPDGSKCYVCEETIYLRSYKSVLYINGQRSPAWNELRVCGSCRDVIVDDK